MPFKTIMVKTSVYDKIQRHKKKGEGFSDLFERTYDKPDITKFYGCLKITEKEADAIKKEIAENRKLAEREFQTRVKHVLS